MRRSMLIALTAVSLLLTGCVIGMVVDWAPVDVILMIQDAEGHDLLDPDCPDNLIDGTSITFKGDTYYASSEMYEKYHLESEPETKAYMPFFNGLQLSIYRDYQTGDKSFCLNFGEIDGAADMDEDLVVTWVNGMQATIHYHCSNHREIISPKCKRTWKLDGKKADSNVFCFVAE